MNKKRTNDIDRYREELTFYGFERDEDGVWVNDYRGTTVSMTGLYGAGACVFACGDALCSVFYPLEKTPDMARRLAETLLFAFEDNEDNEDGVDSNTPDISAKMLPDIFETAYEVDEDTSEPVTVYFWYANLAVAVAFSQVFADEFNKRNGKSLEPLVRDYVQKANRWIVEENNRKAAVAIAPEAAGENGSKYCVKPVFVEMVRAALEV